MNDNVEEKTVCEKNICRSRESSQFHPPVFDNLAHRQALVQEIDRRLGLENKKDDPSKILQAARLTSALISEKQIISRSSGGEL